jgi:hypothetical protein
MAPRLKIVFPEPQPEPSRERAEERGLAEYAEKLATGLGSSPAPHRVNIARLQLADRYFLVCARSPKRLRGRLAACFLAAYARLWAVKEAVDEPPLARPAKPKPERKEEAYLPPEIRLPEG